jgi:predicted ATPase/DNA-binding CsgD family transcriptional regulator
MGRRVEGAGTELRAAGSERSPGHVRLGVPSNLPAELSTFVGRTDDLERGARLLGESRLVTFTGAGGCGKTRLARQVAARVAEHFPGGVWWVELASLADGALVTDRLARTLGLQAGETDAVVDYFADSAALLLLDNCEHIVEGVAEFVTAVLRGAGLIRVLATSRHPLGVEGEATWRVPSLAVPPPAADPATWARFDAVRLFLERARQARSEVTLTPAVAQVCRRLDGIPLALELAAARVGGVAIDRLVDELDDRFRLLTGGSRVGLARHRTLLASVEWSYELLDPDERVLLRRLGVFAGGWTVEAARQVAGFAPLDPAGVLDLLGRLVDKSLAQLDDSGRYTLLETIRAYARTRAAEAGETSTVAGRHLAWAVARTTPCGCSPGTRPRRRRCGPARAGPAPTTAFTPSILTGRPPRRTSRLRRRSRLEMRPPRDGAGTCSPRPRSWSTGACQVFLARLDRRDGVAAEQQAHAGLAEITDAALWAEVPDALELLGGFAIDSGSFAEGARLLAAATALHERMGQQCWIAAEVERDRARAVAELGDDFPRIATEGQRLDGPAAVAYARRARGERRRPSFGWDSLTPTELEVVRLAAAGLTNPAIGERLFISRGTVKTHLLHVFAKLGVHTRAELAAAAIRHGLG